MEAAGGRLAVKAVGQAKEFGEGVVGVDAYAHGVGVGGGIGTAEGVAGAGLAIGRIGEPRAGTRGVHQLADRDIDGVGSWLRMMQILGEEVPADPSGDDRELAVGTRRIRRHFLSEYLHHAQQAADAIDITVGELMDPARAGAWLSDAADGKTRTRNTLSGPVAAAYANSMRVRIDSYNAFAEFLCLPDRLDSEPPARGFHLTPADTERLLHDLTVRRPVHANAATSLRTAALAAVVADTGRSVPELARLNLSALHLDGEARVELAGESCPLGGASVQILARWLSARAVIIAELEGSDPGYLWIPTKPGRPRGGRQPVKPGLSRAAVRTLHAAHRTLVTQLLGTPLRPGALREAGLSRTRSSHAP